MLQTLAPSEPLVEDSRQATMDSAVTVDRLRASAADMLGPATAYGPGYVATIWDGRDEALVVDSTTTVQQVVDFQKTLRKPPAKYRLEIRIDKARVLEDALAGTNAQRSVWFLFTSSIGALVRSGLKEFGEALGLKEAKPVRLLVGDSDARREGPVLELVGVASNPVQAPRQRDVQQETISAIGRFQDYRKVGAGRWRQLDVGDLTPLHTSLGDGQSSTAVEHILDSVTVGLCLVCTSTRVQAPGPDTVLAWYEGGSTSVEVTLPVFTDQPAGQHTAVRPELVSAGSTRALANVAVWCYEQKEQSAGGSWADQRLGFFQVRVAQVLDGAATADRASALLRQAAGLSASMDTQWRTFVEDRIQGYLDEQKELDELVETTVRSFGERSGTITKSLIDAMLAAIAALIGSAVAAAFKSPFNAELFQLGMYAYASYVLLFPGIIGLWLQVSRFQAEQRNYNARRRRFADLLGEAPVKELESERISDATSSFWIWFTVAVVGFVIAFVGSLILAVTVPGIVQSNQTSTSPASTQQTTDPPSAGTGS